VAREAFRTYWRIRHRVTGLFHSGRSRRVVRWTTSGGLFKSRRLLHDYLLGLDEVPREWELVPVELVSRDDRTASLRVYFELWRRAHRTREDKRREREERQRMRLLLERDGDGK
jgi:hypothetical protein